MKKNLTEKDLNRIVKKVVSENKKETSEGLKDTWTGVKGFFRGHGYNYSKNLSKLYNILEDISYSDSYLEKIKLKCEQIVDDAANAKMPDEKSEHILNIANNIISTIESYDDKMDKISDDITRIIK
jgi:hypothetical protein